MSRHIIVRITDETEVDGDLKPRSTARVAEVIQGGFNTYGEAEQGMHDLIHQGDDPDTLIVRYSPRLSSDPAIGSWLTFNHR